MNLELTALKTWANQQLKSAGVKKAYIRTHPDGYLVMGDIPLDAAVLWTSDEVVEFKTNGFLEMVIQWQPGDILRNPNSMEKVKFRFFSADGWFFAEGKRGALKCERFVRLPGDNDGH